MKRMGRKYRPFFRIVAIDGKQPRDGRVLEELGTYDPMMKDKENRVKFNAERVKHWLGVGAQPSEKVEAMLKKHMKRMEETAVAAPAETPPTETPPAEEPAANV